VVRGGVMRQRAKTLKVKAVVVGAVYHAACFFRYQESILGDLQRHTTPRMYHCGAWPTLPDTSPLCPICGRGDPETGVPNGQNRQDDYGLPV
jgi:hypothetical protein